MKALPSTPGYRGAQDTFHVGAMRGVGRIYRQSFVDACAEVAFAELHDRKTPITAADLLNDRVLPFHDEHGVEPCRVLTDRGTEFCGGPGRHGYRLYLAVEDIGHTKTKAKSPQTTDEVEHPLSALRATDEFEHPLSALRATFLRRMGDRVAKSGARRWEPRRAAYGRSSFAASMRARRGPFGCHPLVRRP